jgi:hypothetical protein
MTCDDSRRKAEINKRNVAAQKIIVCPCAMVVSQEWLVLLTWGCHIQRGGKSHGTSWVSGSLRTRNVWTSGISERNRLKSLPHPTNCLSVCSWSLQKAPAKARHFIYHFYRYFSFGALWRKLLRSLFIFPIFMEADNSEYGFKCPTLGSKWKINLSDLKGKSRTDCLTVSADSNAYPLHWIYPRIFLRSVQSKSDKFQG